MKLKDKVAIVSGGARDIGSVVSIKLSTEGAKVANATALRREGSAAEVADTVAYLASDESSFLTGVNLDINGGLFYS